MAGVLLLLMQARISGTLLLLATLLLLKQARIAGSLRLSSAPNSLAACLVVELRAWMP
jgi:hypothetical protein